MDTNPPEGPEMATPDLESDPEVQRAQAVVMARLFPEEMEVPKIGRYPIFARVGQGAMGVVYACYDAQLDRRIAVKVLRTDIESPSVRERMIREAQAMAKLSHPNVAHVYEVGEHDGRMFVAMEFVKGKTLREWVRAEPRRWQVVLSTCVAAGRGLAAAHDQGLTHRDYKPDNVMVGDDGRVRVMDFGLVRVEAKSSTQEVFEETSPGTGERVTQLTRRGVLVGTPAYMAPEQLRAVEAGPAADQFAYCVTLWEALYGERPFVGNTVAELAENLQRGKILEPTTTKVPSWLRGVLGRGLRVEASERFPSMAALLAALERGTARARTRRVFAAIGVIALLGAGTEGWRRYDRARAIAGCEAAGATIQEAWNDNARGRLRDALVATGVSYAETTAEKVMPFLDAQATAWQRARTEACLNADVRAVWNEDTLDRSLWCLDERRMELEALVGELSHPDETAMQKAVSAAARLSSVDGCHDASLLERTSLPPAERREEIRAARAELSRADALERMGDYANALDVARSTRERGEALGWAPLSAAARVRESSLLERKGAYEEAEQFGAYAYFEAARVGAWDVAAAAASDLTFVVGYRLARHADGIVWSGHAEVALAHAGDPDALQEAGRLGRLGTIYRAAGDHTQARTMHERAVAIFERALGLDHPDVARSLNGLAGVIQDAGEYPQARTMHERAVAILERALGPDHPEIASIFNNLALAHESIGEYAQARTQHERALAIREKALGPDHPDVAASLNNLASVHAATGEYARARTLHERALAIREKSLGPDHPRVAHSLANLAGLHKATGDYAQARTLYERALAIQEKALGPDHPDVALNLIGLGILHLRTGDYVQARTLYERALAIQEKTLGPDHPDIVVSLNNLAFVAESTGEYARARALYKRALAIEAEPLGPDHNYVAVSLSGLARVHLANGEDHEAVPLLERAVNIYDQHDGIQENELAARFALAKALVVTGGDRARARVRAEQARDGWRESGEGKAKELAEVEEWLRRLTREKRTQVKK